ncbi:MAG: YajG family lipoprotein [Burkholderiales bacterium]
MKIRSLILTTAIGMVVLLQGCGLKPQYLHLDPPVSASSQQTGDGSLIGLAVNDLRTDEKLGEVGDPLNEMVGVYLTEDFRPAIYKRVSKALTDLGFEIVPYSDAMIRWIQIDIKSLELTSEKTAFNFETELRAEVGVRGAGQNETYDRAFFVRTFQETATPPYARHSNELVNSAVSQALTDALTDQQLMGMLTR